MKTEYDEILLMFAVLIGGVAIGFEMAQPHLISQNITQLNNGLRLPFFDQPKDCSSEVKNLTENNNLLSVELKNTIEEKELFFTYGRICTDKLEHAGYDVSKLRGLYKPCVLNLTTTRCID